LCVAVVAGLPTLLGLFEYLSLDVSPKGFIYLMEWHFASVFGDPNFFNGSATGHGGFGYSYFFFLLKYSVEQLYHPSLAADMRIVQVFNIAFALLIVVACRLVAPNRPWLTFLVVFLVIPWMNNSHENFYLANQSGWRF